MRLRGRGTPAEPPGWDGEPRGEPGIHGLARSRRWDAVVVAEAPGLDGTELDRTALGFVVLADGSTVSDPGPSATALAPLLAAVAGSLAPPYRAEAVRRGGTQWAVAAARIRVTELPTLAGEEAELVLSAGRRTFHVDGRPSFVAVPALESIGAKEGREYVVRAHRLRAAFWEVEAEAL